LKIVVFADEVFPSEHLFGLLNIVKKSINYIDLVFISSEPNHKSFHQESLGDRFRVLDAGGIFSVFKTIYNADIVVCMPSKYMILRIFSRLNLLKFVPLYCGPGKVTKAIGFYKHPEGSALKALKIYLKFIFLNTYFLANDRLDALYNAASLGYPLSRIFIAPLPKYFYINERLRAGQMRDRPKGVLFAPTHRWRNNIPPLTKLLEDENLVRKFENLNVRIFHSMHPDTKEAPLYRGINKFLGNWDDIDIVVTDYSSIGNDFINSGGSKLIYFIPDREVFESNQGVGLFFDNSLALGSVCTEVDSLVANLLDFLECSEFGDVVELLYPYYFDDLISACKSS
jgi:hypothetical protein